VAFHALLTESALGWQKKTPLPTRRSDMACSLIAGNVYISGGCAGDQAYYSNNSACAILRFHFFSLFFFFLKKKQN